MSQDYQLRTVSRTLELLKFLETAPGPMTLTEIASRIDEATPVVFRILKTLLSHGFLVRDPGDKRYSIAARGDGLQSAHNLVRVLRALSAAPDGLTRGGVEKALAFSDTSGLLKYLTDEGLVRELADDRWALAPGLLDIARPLLDTSLISLARSALERVRNELGETVVLFRVTGKQQTVIDVAPSNEPIRYVATVGATFALHRGAAGKAALAGMSQRAFDDYLADARLAAEKVDTAKLRADIGRTRTRGYAISFGERAEGAAAAATWLNENSEVPAAVISVMGPAFRLDRQTLDRIGGLLKSERDRILTPRYAAPATRNVAKSTGAPHRQSVAGKQA